MSMTCSDILKTGFQRKKSKTVVLLLLLFFSGALCLPLSCNAELTVLSSFAIISPRKCGLVAVAEEVRNPEDRFSCKKSKAMVLLSLLRGQKFHLFARNYMYQQNLERMSALGRITRGSHITYYSLLFFIG